jgi:phage shock protein C
MSPVPPSAPSETPGAGPPPPPPPSNRTEQRPALRRPREDRLLFGVCAGVARYLDLDATLVRVVAVLLTVFGGSGVLLYLVGLVLMPPEDATEDPASDRGRPEGATAAIGAGLIGVGAVLLAGQLVPGFASLFTPVLLIALGVGLILGGRR